MRQLTSALLHQNEVRAKPSISKPAARVSGKIVPLSTAEKTRNGMVAELLRQNPTLDDLRQVAAHCKACDLWKTGTQTVFGDGVATAKVMFVGEQPGDREDLAGRPFVGPAGLLLDRALAQAGIERSQVYVTNVVKHFKWVRDERGKRRIHKKPRASEINACRPWLDAEIAVVRPQVLLCLGATAAQALLGRHVSVNQDRGRFVESSFAPHVMATVHPSSVLRSPDSATRHAEMKRFVQDLKRIADLLQEERAAA